MTLYEKYAEAWDAKNIDMLAALCHPNLEMVMHSSGSVISKTEYITGLEPLIKNFSPENLRCLYENENVLVMHFIMPFPNGSKDAVLYYIEKKDGLIQKIETGSTSIKLRRNK
jgi:hypothetical protein